MSHDASSAEPRVQAVHHEVRNASNSASFVLPALTRLQSNNVSLKILDVGCGSGSITASFARLAPEGHVTGIDSNPSILPRARAVSADLDNIDFFEGDAHVLPFADTTFDVVFCHQVLVWAPRQWDVLGEMMRVTKLGGIVAVREGDYETEAIWPEIPVLMKQYPHMVRGAMNAAGGSSTAGRRLVDWAVRAGAKREQIQLTFSTWLYQGAEKEVWAQGLINICRAGKIRDTALEKRFLVESDFDDIIKGWEEWAARDDASVAMMHGEIVIQR